MPLPGVPERRFRSPEWARLLLTNPKSCFGIVVFGGMVLAALFAPVLAQNPPDEFVALPGQPPNRDFWFGTTDQGFDVFSRFPSSRPNARRTMSPIESSALRSSVRP